MERQALEQVLAASGVKVTAEDAGAVPTTTLPESSPATQRDELQAAVHTTLPGSTADFVKAGAFPVMSEDVTTFPVSSTATQRPSGSHVMPPNQFPSSTG